MTSDKLCSVIQKIIAHQNKDKKITNGELQAYMKSNVSQKASEWGREQNPSLVGDPNKILMSYR